MEGFADLCLTTRPSRLYDTKLKTPPEAGLTSRLGGRLFRLGRNLDCQFLLLVAPQATHPFDSSSKLLSHKGGFVSKTDLSMSIVIAQEPTQNGTCSRPKEGDHRFDGRLGEEEKKGASS